MYGVRLISKDFEWNVPNVLRWSDLFYVRLFPYLKSKSINAMISIQICINKDAIANFFIVPPPPIVGRDEPNSRWWLFKFYYSTKFSKSFIFCCDFSLRNTVSRSSLVAFLSDKITQTQEEHDMFSPKERSIE